CEHGILRHIFGCRDGRAGISRVGQRVTTLAIGEAGSVPKQILDRRWLLWCPTAAGRHETRTRARLGNPRSASAGRYFGTWSPRSTRPCSTSNMIAVEVMGLVMDAIEKMASVVSGSSELGSR